MQVAAQISDPVAVVREAFRLMNSMIACGESHSVTSTNVLEQAYAACDALENERLATSTQELIEAKDLLKRAKKYVAGAYECAFPDEQANRELLEDIDHHLAAPQGEYDPEPKQGA